MAYGSVLHDILRQARTLLWGLNDGTKIARAGGAFGDERNDTELNADERLGNFFAREIPHQIPNVALISVEGHEPKVGSPDGTLWATVDPLDGSLNYMMAGQTTGLPFSSCITLFEKVGPIVTFDHVIAAGVIDLRRGIEDVWLSERHDGVYCTRVGGLHVPLRQARAVTNDLDLGKMVVIAEMYYPDNRERVVRAFAGRKGWLRNPGSAAYEMSLVASGQAGAFICDRQKQDVLGAGYALVKGAGGVVVDWDGHDLCRRVYDFKAQTPVILAANRRIADQVLELLRN